MDIQFGFDIAASISIIGAAIGFMWSLWAQRLQSKNQFAIIHLSKLVEELNKARLENYLLCFSLGRLFSEMDNVETEQEKTTLNKELNDCIDQIKRHFDKTNRIISYFADSFLKVFATATEDKEVQALLKKITEKQNSIIRGEPRKLGVEIVNLDAMYELAVRSLAGMLKRRHV